MASLKRIRQIAVRMLMDYDRRQPNRIFTEEPSRWLSLADAYRVQRCVRDLRVSRGDRPCGYKIGCVSPVIQKQLGLNQPVRGFLWENECHSSGACLRASQYASLAIEGEIALHASRSPPSAARSDKELRSCFDGWFPIIELHQQVFAGPRSTSEELVAGNAMHAGFVRPDRRKRSVAALATVDQSVIRIEIDGVEVEKRSLTELPGGIWAGVRWLIADLDRTGGRLKRGEIILTGSPGRLIHVLPKNKVAVYCGACRVDLVIEP
jgi:2-keto-4-pentenoate hydratase